MKKEGSLWDTSIKVYGAAGAKPRLDNLSWTFPPYNTKITFGHLEHEKNMLDWQGAQIAFIGFDELTHFTRKQFFYMLSRNRSGSGVRPYIRATCNPDSDSWVADLLGGPPDGESQHDQGQGSGSTRTAPRRGGLTL